MILFIDTETYSPVPFEQGLARYALEVEVMLVSWAIDDGPAEVWDATKGTEPPQGLLRAVRQADLLVAHNAMFDRTVLERTDWWPRIGLEKWYCTMAQVYRHGLPGGLDKLCHVFKIDASEAKLPGKEFINLFCKPQKDGSRATRKTHPEEWKRFMEYARMDIPAMRRVYHACPKWNDTPDELALWRLDQEINERGVGIDLDFAQAAVAATTAEAKRLGKQVAGSTDDFVLRATQRDKLLVYLFTEYGIMLPDLRADTIQRRLDDPELPESMKELLRLRQQSSKSSTSKYKRALQLHVAGRMHHLFQYAGAYRTGRWGGRNFQPQNLKRPEHKWPQIEGAINAAIDGYLPQYCEAIDTDVMSIMSSAVRSVLRAKDGCELAVADLAGIEGRKAAWLANEEWKLQAYRDYDAKIGPDTYKLAYARAFNISPDDVDSYQRQIGKVMELSMQYGGGVGAFVSLAAGYGLDLEAMAQRVLDVAPTHIIRDAEDMYRWACKKGVEYGLPKNVYVACEILKRLWRDAHPMITSTWPALENAARAAILNPGRKYPVGRLTMDRVGGWLRMHLPSGRYLCYPSPRIEHDAISFGVWNVYRKCWSRDYTYGGKLFENGTQASARDVLRDGMLAADAVGFPITMHVHDEIVAEVPRHSGLTHGLLCDLMSQGAPWTKGLPLAAEGKTMIWYAKG